MHRSIRRIFQYPALLGLLFGAQLQGAAAQQPSEAQADAIRQSCRSDFQVACPGVTPGGKAALACLQRSASLLSPPCQQAVSAINSPATPGTTGTPGGAAGAPSASPPPHRASPRQQAA